MISKQLIASFILVFALPHVSLAAAPSCQNIFNPDIQKLDRLTVDSLLKELRPHYELIFKLKTESGRSIEDLVIRYQELDLIFRTEFKVANSTKTTLELAAVSLKHNIRADGIAKYLVLIHQNFVAKSPYKIPFRVQATLAEYGLNTNTPAPKLVATYLVEFSRAQQEGPANIYAATTPFDQALEAFKY